MPQPANTTADKGRVGALILAAGAGERFGTVKQVAPLAGRPLLDHALSNAAAVAGLERRILVLGAHSKTILEKVDHHGAEALRCASWRDGMSAPLRSGVAALSDLDAIVILLGDQPLIGPDAISRVLAARREDRPAVRATYCGKPGHPVVIEASLFDAVGSLRGDQGARSILDRSDTLEVPCDDVADPIDVDRPADLDAAGKALLSPRTPGRPVQGRGRPRRLSV